MSRPELAFPCLTGRNLHMYNIAKKEEQHEINKLLLVLEQQNAMNPRIRDPTPTYEQVSKVISMIMGETV